MLVAGGVLLIILLELRVNGQVINLGRSLVLDDQLNLTAKGDIDIPTLLRRSSM